MGLYRISGWFVCHDLRYSGSVECVVERDTAPSEADAELLLWPLADAHVQRTFPGEGPATWRNDFTRVTVREQPRLGIAGAAGAVGGQAADSLAHYAPVLVVRDATRAPNLGLAVRSCEYADEPAAVATDDATFTLGRDHHDTEEAIRDSGMRFTCPVGSTSLH